LLNALHPDAPAAAARRAPLHLTAMEDARHSGDIERPMSRKPEETPMIRVAIVTALLNCAALSATAAVPAGPATKIAQPPKVMKSTIEKTCGNVTYVLSTGTKKGICGNGVSVAECTDGGNSAKASCSKGCESSTGAGSCTTK
jgi:hypothetical protein